MEEKVKEYMEWIWNKQPCRQPLKLCKWYEIRDQHDFFHFLGLKENHRGRQYEED